MADRKKVLITGAAGRIGNSLREHLKDRYTLRLLYHNKVLPEEGEEIVLGDIADMDAMLAAMDGMDSVVHMAAIPGEDTFDRILSVNIHGTYTVLEAARQCGANRVVFASTNHVTGMYEKKGPVYTTPNMPVRPDSYYGVSKAFGEAIGRYYVDRFDMAVFCLRIGSFVPTPTSVRCLSTWISARDMAQLVWRCIEAEDVRFGIYYGISNNTRKYWDISNAQREIGYAPEDDGEEYAENLE